MSERYTRIFSLPAELPKPGAPVVVLAGILARDNMTGQIVAQLRYRNVSNKPLTSLTVRLNGCDGAKGKTSAVESYTYTKLNVVPNGEFGTDVLIPLSDPATKSFTIDILPSEAVTPYIAIAPQMPLRSQQEGKPLQDPKVAVRSAIFSKIIVITSLISMLLVLACFIEDLDILDHIEIFRRGRFTGYGGLEGYMNNVVFYDFHNALHRAFYGMIVPFIALTSALLGRKKSVIPKLAFVLCGLLLCLQILMIVATSILYSSFLNNMFNDTALHELYSSLYDNFYGANLYGRVSDSLRMIPLYFSQMKWGMLIRRIWFLIVSFFGIISNILPTAALLFFGFRIKES